MIASARMYAVSAAAAATWRRLFDSVARDADQPLTVIDHAAPLPIGHLWERTDKAAVFMCGLPYSRARPRPQLLAAPVPSPSEFEGRPQYWSEFIVATDSSLETLQDTLGRRVAFTTHESQSGFAAPLRWLARYAEEQALQDPLFSAVVAPVLTPPAAVAAVAEHEAEVAAVDAYALHLLRRFQPQLGARVRTIARTEPRPIPPLVGEPAAALSPLQEVIVRAHEAAPLRGSLAPLLLSRFVALPAQVYDGLQAELESALAYWRRHPLAVSVHEGFAPHLIGTA